MLLKQVCIWYTVNEPPSCAVQPKWGLALLVVLHQVVELVLAQLEQALGLAQVEPVWGVHTLLSLTATCPAHPSLGERESAMLLGTLTLDLDLECTLATLAQAQHLAAREVSMMPLVAKLMTGA